MRKNRVVEQNRCYHLVSRLAHRAFFLDDEEKDRAILPRETDNLAVIGLGLSASRDAMPILRMIPDVQNQGWVAAKACEHALREGKALKDIDVRSLQRDLIAKKILPEWVLTAKDSLPVSDARLARRGERSGCLKELSLARALYRIGDDDGLGERTLRLYLEDPRRAYAQHARLVLEKSR